MRCGVALEFELAVIASAFVRAVEVAAAVQEPLTVPVMMVDR